MPGKRPHVASYNEIGDRAHARSFALISDMREALVDSGQFSLVYSGDRFRVRQVHRRRGACCAGATRRWRYRPGGVHPTRRSTALIRPLTAWVIDTGAAQWPSGLGLANIQNFDQHIGAKFDESDFAATLARLRPSTRGRAPPFRSNSPKRTRRLQRARLGAGSGAEEDGDSIAIDDFVPAMRLSYLQQLPGPRCSRSIQSFIKSLSTASMTRNWCGDHYMAHDGYRVVAEGVETMKPTICWPHGNATRPRVPDRTSADPDRDGSLVRNSVKGESLTA